MVDDELNRMNDDGTPLGVEESPLGSDCLDQVRISPFSPWPHIHPSHKRIVEAGFQPCNMGDRTICLDCNLICEKWKSILDDPYEVHKILSPNCDFVKRQSEARPPPHAINFDFSSTVSPNNAPNSAAPQPVLPTCVEIVLNMPSNDLYSDVSTRYMSYAHWPKENLTSVEDLVRAGFFYTGRRTIVTCFYCNGSLQNWRPNHNPLVEHARWFPHCAYARQLCDDDLFRRIHESQPEPINANQQQRPTLGESALARLMGARLDLPVSQRLLASEFHRCIIKRCWEDQVQLHGAHHVSEIDLRTACLVLQKQIRHLGTNGENIVVPSLKMKAIQEQAEASLASRNGRHNHVPVTTNKTESGELTQETSPTTNTNDSSNNPASNSCVVYFQAEQQVACIPCGHWVVCVPCARPLQSCPSCRREIEAFFRLYA